MIVEDDDKIADILGSYLQRYGYEPVRPSSLQDIKSEFLATGPHLVLLDINLPSGMRQQPVRRAWAGSARGIPEDLVQLRALELEAGSEGRADRKESNTRWASGGLRVANRAVLADDGINTHDDAHSHVRGLPLLPGGRVDAAFQVLPGTPGGPGKVRRPPSACSASSRACLP